MNVLVYDVAAESGGAVSILEEFYQDFQEKGKNHYYFLLSIYKMKKAPNITILQYPWIKKSWFHRLYFDYFIAPKLINKYDIDQVISLQNTMIPRTHIMQTIYEHNAIPFSAFHFSFWESPYLWFYQNIIAKNICHSLKKADKIIVQTNWMKERCINQLKIPAERISVRFPKTNLNPAVTYQKKSGQDTYFFYPAAAVLFKNHSLVIKACQYLKSQGISNYRIIFTIGTEKNRNIQKLRVISEAEDLPIEFCGWLTKEQVFEHYLHNILLFPSYLETVGLPLIEAKSYGTPIIAADCEYAHEALIGYDNVDYFDPNNEKLLAEIMRKKIDQE